MEAVNLIIKGIPKKQMYDFIQVLSQMASNMNTDVNLKELAKRFPTKGTDYIKEIKSGSDKVRPNFDKIK